jgi:hypothetical protein
MTPTSMPKHAEDLAVGGVALGRIYKIEKEACENGDNRDPNRRQALAHRSEAKA